MLGVVGVYSREGSTKKDNATLNGVKLLYGVNHRGQESAGLSAGGNRCLRTWKGKGLVSNVFNVFDEKFNSFAHPDDYVAIGCASAEKANSGYIPPLVFESEYERYDIALAMDGFVFNRGEKSNEEIFGDMFLKNIKKIEDIEPALARTMEELDDVAYYSLVMALYDKETERSELIAARDKCGIRPLYMGMNDKEFFVASESTAIASLENIDIAITKRGDIAPGSMIRYNDGLDEKQVLEPRRAYCAFEFVYFGDPDSVMEGRAIHLVRKRLGNELVKLHPIEVRENTIVVPVPDSGRSMVAGVAKSLGVMPDEGIKKNPYLGRTYIIHDPEYRKEASLLKHSVIKEVVEGKHVLIGDDSIVRGTVSESIAHNMLKAGADEVEFFVSYAPIFHPCFSDPPDKPLTAAPYEGKDLFEIGDIVASNIPSINKVRYNSVENVVSAIGLPERDLCMMCITGKNPFERQST